jgi:Concanavalin A-like lectin/glucanases superfamily
MALSGCGRLGFDGRPDAAGAVADGAVADGALSDLVFRVNFEGDATDVAGGRSPTCIGCPIEYTASPSGLGQALRLKGAECLEYADDPALRPVQFTLSAWIRMDQSRTSSVLGKAFEADTTEGNSYEFWVDNTGDVFFTTVDVDKFVWYMGVVPLTWYHVVGTFDGVTKRIYVDGVERMASDVAMTSYDADPFRIGCDRAMAAIQNFFIGDVDDVRLYSRALAPSEVAALAAELP